MLAFWSAHDKPTQMPLCVTHSRVAADSCVKCSGGGRSAEPDSSSFGRGGADNGALDPRVPGDGAVEAHESDIHHTLVAAARRAVGTIGLVEAQRLVRRAMFAEALERASGNRHAVARLLDVDRRYVTRMVKDGGTPPGPDSPA
jgi:DNA-binding NtrC family response regulator